ncbi:hypothetical protein [Haliangium ochraceum]|uniref:Uncharacterized protein n=1 Tax=Haliangium ochraceum (strain DSM 14365 / JCM 11303 / SMP-2) TaxID=502025 RepID=D0LYQ4_HALO1|nr:hypothetical protein [Haliangium ochraceum]ACY17920.1 hypothetical protein Hoch_5437 [Haliangium ochraceum DSM 14365]
MRQPVVFGSRPSWPIVDGPGEACDVVDRGQLASHLYRLGRAQATGSLVLRPSAGAPEAVLLERGFAVTGARDPAGHGIARRLAELASAARVHSRLGAPGEHERSAEGARSLHLAAWARAHLESQLDTRGARRLLTELAGLPLVLVGDAVPPAVLCDETDRRILAAMETPRPLHEIWRQARTSRFRLLGFLHFLRGVGAIELPADAPRPVHRVRRPTEPWPCP